MLLRAHIIYFRSCRNVEIDDLENVTALIGRNGVGKSNVLRAIAWAARMATGSQSTDRARLLSEFGDVTLEFRLNDTYYRYTVSADVRHDTSPVRLLQSESLYRIEGQAAKLLASKSEAGVQISDGQNSHTFLADPSYAMLPSIARLPGAAEWTTRYADISNFLGGIRYYPLNEPNYEHSSSRELLTTRDFIEWMQNSSSERFSHADAVMRILAMHLFSQESQQELVDLLGDNGLNLIGGVQIIPYTPQKRETPQQITFNGVSLADYYAVGFYPPGSSEDDAAHPLSFDELSHGTRRVLDLIAAVLYDRSSVMLIEHPEDAVHIGLLTKIMGILESYSEEVQVVLATHSRAILNTLQIKQLRFVEFADGVTRVFKLRGDGLAAAERYITTEDADGGTVAEFVESMAGVIE